jgi:hypothetical protein
MASRRFLIVTALYGSWFDVRPPAASSGRRRPALAPSSSLLVVVIVPPRCRMRRCCSARYSTISAARKCVTNVTPLKRFHHSAVMFAAPVASAR